MYQMILELSALFSRTNCASQDGAAKRQLLAAKEPHGFEAKIDGSWSDIVFFKMFNQCQLDLFVNLSACYTLIYFVYH